ncbi:hypothetical protein O0L34_g2727 [Tuta absoluta]|nr:hypothetical protein O0L34_g2727 [Tuta absoluta]
MGAIHLLLISLTVSVYLVKCAVIPDDEPEQQGLYSKSDHVHILTKANFDRKVYGKKYGQLVQFYNSYCGHCRAFYPKFRILALEVLPWKQVFQIGVIDCFNDENTEICREFDVMSYPSMRYLHENFVKGNKNVGDKIELAESPEGVKVNIIKKIQQEQQMGRFKMGPQLNIGSYGSYEDALHDVPRDIQFTFIVIEDTNSTIGSEIALDISSYPHVRVKRVNAYSDLANLANIRSYPALAVVGTAVQPTVITPHTPTVHNMLQAINQFLTVHNYPILRDIIEDSTTEKPHSPPVDNSKKVYYSDFEKTIRSILHTEINTKVVTGESHTALVNFLQVLVDDFPFKTNRHLQAYLEELLTNVESVSTWSPTTLGNLIRDLEKKHNPYQSMAADYIGCQGSQPNYRGYTCGLWTLFHTLTVGAASKSNNEGPKVLRAMHGFIKHFFGCTECVEHFTAMAARNRLFDVKDNDRAVLWLWVSHNEVNLRLAGDATEDPVHPKIQFPSVYQCPQCRHINGAWKLPDVYNFLLSYYSSQRIIDDDQVEMSAAQKPGQLSNLDLGMLSFLYSLSA